MPSSIYECAKALVKHGISCVPIVEGQKWPSLEWKTYQERCATEAELKKWFTSRHNSIGIVGGAVSGNLEIMDFDWHGSDHFAEFCLLCGEGKLYDLVKRCVIARSPSGGHHMYYRCEAKVGSNTKLARQNKEAKALVKIETRGEGGQVLSYPTKGYRFIQGTPLSLPIITEKELKLLHAVAGLLDEYVDEVKPAQAPRSAHKTDYSNDGISPWADYNERGNYEEVLEKHGWRRMRCNANNHCMWARPGKTDGGISATTGFSGRRLFYCFSSNAAPFDGGKGYNPFGVYARLEHGGSNSDAVKRLRELGYGDIRVDGRKVNMETGEVYDA